MLTLYADGAICAEEMTNSLIWPATTIGSNSSQFCLQNKCEPYTFPITTYSTKHAFC